MTSTQTAQQKPQPVRLFGNLGRNVEEVETKPKPTVVRHFDPIIEEMVDVETETESRRFKTFSIAVNYRDNGQICTRWIKVLDFHMPSITPHIIRKGDRVGVEGTMRTRTYVNRAGQPQTETQIVADRIWKERMANVPEIP